MDNVISIVKYKKQKGIALPRSPYFTLNATKEQIIEATEQASKILCKSFDYSGRLPYAVLIGYEDRNGRTKLLKTVCIYSSKELLEADSGRNGLSSVFVVAR